MTIHRSQTSDIYLEEKCVKAIQNGLSMDHLLLQLRAEGHAIGNVRLRRVWLLCGGPIKHTMGRF